MRVLTYTSLFPSSTAMSHGVFIYQRMRHFARRPGNSVTVVAPVPYVPSWIKGAKATAFRSIPQREELDGSVVYHPRYLLLPKISMILHGLLMYLGSRSLLRELNTQKFDLIDAHYVYPDGFAAMFAARMMKVPFVVSARGTDMNEFPRFRTIRPMIRKTLKHAAGTIGVCTPLRDAMVDFGADPNASVTIGNGIDVTRFSPVPMDEARRTLGIGDGRVVVSVGSLIPRKRHDSAIKAIAALWQQGIKVSFYIVGEGESRADLQAHIHRLGVDKHVFLVGAVPNDALRLWYSAANVSCLVSSREGWANVLLESMACGTPVVATRVWGTPEVIVSDRLGLLCELDDMSLTAVLRMALTRSWEREFIVDYARKRTWESVAAEVESFFDSRLSHVKMPEASSRGTKHD